MEEVCWAKGGYKKELVALFFIRQKTVIKTKLNFISLMFLIFAIISSETTTFKKIIFFYES